MLELDFLKSMRPMICTPAFGSGTFSTYVTSLVKLTCECVKIGMEFELEMRAESLITESRNRLVSQFLTSKCTHLFWIDADVGFTPEQFARLLLADRDVVGGVYPLKRYEWPDFLPKGMTRGEFEARYVPYPFNTLDGKVTSDEEGFGKVKETANGFLCIKRHVFDKMMKCYPELQIDPSDKKDDEAPGTHWAFFDTMIEAGTRRPLTEDYAFCKRWRDLGGDIWIDLHSRLSHSGPRTWEGDLFSRLNTVGAPKEDGQKIAAE